MSGLITPKNTWWTDSEALDIKGKITLHCISDLPVGHWVKNICLSSLKSNLFREPGQVFFYPSINAFFKVWVLTIDN